MSTAAQQGQGAVTLRCIVLTTVQFQTATDALLRTMFIDLKVARLQQYIYQVRPRVQDEDSTRPMTHHGLRHSYAARTYQELLNNGMSPLSASLQVSQLLGHERPDVTKGYLASIPKDGANGK